MADVIDDCRLSDVMMMLVFIVRCHQTEMESRMEVTLHNRDKLTIFVDEVLASDDFLNARSHQDLTKLGTIYCLFMQVGLSQPSDPLFKRMLEAEKSIRQSPDSEGKK